MKRFVILSIILLVSVSCGQRSSAPKTEDNTPVDTVMRAHLPFNLHYGMKEAEYKHVRDSLDSKGQMSSWGTVYKYENVRLSMSAYYDGKGGLAQLELSSLGQYDSKQTEPLEKGFLAQAERLLTEQGINLNAYTRTEKDAFGAKKKYHKTIRYTRPGYGEIYITNDRMLIIQFRNDEAVADLKKRTEESIQRAKDDALSGRVRQTVENSAWDGSVSQVKNYLKNTLADPKSYEGIEWSPVQKTSDGYKVRHKFRAKNAFGGYVIEEHIFYLNEYGEVVNVI